MMDNNFVLTEDMVNDLKCSLCEHVLSVAPISIISEDATKYKCGRCHGIKTYIETRCFMYEKLAKHMVFPCIYKGCKEKLTWPNVKEHEKKCILCSNSEQYKLTNLCKYTFLKQMRNLTSSDSVVDQLKCALCDFYLSVLPVYLISDDGNQYKCGRCSSIKTMISIKVNLYEHLAKLLTFPCSYKECSEKVLSNDVKDHEKSCAYRTVLCPKANCHDSYKIWAIAPHFKEKHTDLFHTNLFTIKNVYAYYNIDVLERNGRTYISLFDFDDINFGISVCSVENANSCQYEVRLSSDNSKYSITISNQNVIPFNEREHCFKCVNGSCKSKFHLYKDNRKEVSKRMTTKINRDSVKKMFGSGLITYTITILDKAEIKEETKERNESKEDVKDVLIRKAKKIFLQMLECPVCKEYMHPPIYQCLAGHTMCNNCKAKAENCTVSGCNSKIEATRNYILEDLSKKVELPQLDDKKTVKAEGAVKRNNAEDVDGADTPSKLQKK